MDKSISIAAAKFGFGHGPNDAPGIDPQGWLKSQLEGPDPGLASGMFSGLPTGQQAVDTNRADIMARKTLTTASPETRRHGYHSTVLQLYRTDAVAQLTWATQTPSSFRERLVWFWANHFSVSAQSNATAFIGPMIREAIRPHVTGNFTDMVLAVERHPAMLQYLNNNISVGPDSPAGQRTHHGLNENLGRECMELHTVGLAAGYSQADVTSMAKLLTGWGIASSANGGDTTGFKYYPNRHEPGPQIVMGQRFDGGEQAAADALKFLSTHPATYDLLAKKLAIHFMADIPPPEAVSHIAGVLRETNGNLGAASAALIGLPQAWKPGQKFKTPIEYVISTLRAVPPPSEQPSPNLIDALGKLGQPVWDSPLPNGWPDQADAWSGADALVTRVSWAYTYAGQIDNGDTEWQPVDLAQATLGPLLRSATISAMRSAGSRREALTLFLTSSEFQRR